MEFNTLIIERVYPVLKIYGLHLMEQLKDTIRFQSTELTMNMAFNRRECSHFVEIGRRGEELYPINDIVVKEVFKVDLSIEKVSTVIFVENIILLFTMEVGVELLRGRIDLLEQCVTQLSSLHTAEIIQRQSLQEVSDAWERADYQALIGIIDRIGVDKVLPSYRQKYKIAMQKLLSTETKNGYVFKREDEKEDNEF